VSLFVLTYIIVNYRLGPEVSRKHIATVGKSYRHFQLWTRRGRLKFYGRIPEKKSTQVNASKEPPDEVKINAFFQFSIYVLK
jgi:hypothetical protein